MKVRIESILPFITGLILGYVTFNFNPLFQFALPILAFIFGYVSSSKVMGFINSIIFFGSYLVLSRALAMFLDILSIGTLAILVWTFLLIIFVIYGFIGYGGRILKEKGFKNLISLGVLSLILLHVLFLYADGAIPQSDYYVGLGLESPENEFEDLEIYLPAPERSGKLYNEIFDDPLNGNVDNIRDYSMKIVETDYGKMVKFQIQRLPEKSHSENQELKALRNRLGLPEESYRGNLRYRQKMEYPVVYPPYNRSLKLHPKYNISQTTKLTEIQKEEATFKTPIMVKSSKPVSLQIHWRVQSVDRWRIFPFQTRETSYSEYFNFELDRLEDINEWILVEGVISIKRR